MSPRRIKSDQGLPRQFCPCNFEQSSSACTTSLVLGTFRRLWSSLIWSTYSYISDLEMKGFWSRCCSFKLSELLVAVHSNYSWAHIWCRLLPAAERQKLNLAVVVHASGRTGLMHWEMLQWSAGSTVQARNLTVHWLCSVRVIFFW